MTTAQVATLAAMLREIGGRLAHWAATGEEP